jgi:hypothetical protein
MDTANEIELLKKEFKELCDYNVKLPNDINKHFMIMRNDIEDVRDHLDRIEDVIDKKIGKQELTRLRNKIKTIDDEIAWIKSKLLDIEDDFIGMKKNVNNHKCNNCNNEEIKLTIKLLSEKVESINNPPPFVNSTKSKKAKVVLTEEEVLKNKKLKSDISNTKYSIKKLTFKENEHTISDKEKVRLEEKKVLLNNLLGNTTSVANAQEPDIIPNNIS